MTDDKPITVEACPACGHKRCVAYVEYSTEGHPDPNLPGHTTYPIVALHCACDGCGHVWTTKGESK